MAGGASGWSLCFAALILAAACPYTSVATEANRFLIMSAMDDSNVYYSMLPVFSGLARSGGHHPMMEVRVLIDGQASACNASGLANYCGSSADLGLQNVGGIAVEQQSGGAVLYVSDLEAGNVYGYDLWASGSFLHVGRQRRVAESVASSGLKLSVDKYGALYYTGTQAGQVGRIDTRSDANYTEVLYDVNTDAVVSSPGGVAVDNFFVYWANEADGESAGSIVKGMERPEEVAAFTEGENASSGTSSNTTYPIALVSNIPTVQGLCLARDNLFYTDANGPLYGIKSAGGGTVTSVYNFSSPRGCAYDTEGTLYVADSAANAVFTLPANFMTLRSVSSVTEVANLTAVNQLAVFSVGTRGLFDHPPSAASRISGGLQSLLVVVTLVLWQHG
mmetsp:Transcript_44561/g.102898  ORF Transcript_44561/g.102898 Transcript_44561/m.102898 type:complete len:391 (-) Transcript_44561:20-1192(-)